MKQPTRAAICMLLTALMVFGLTACSAPDTQPEAETYPAASVPGVTVVQESADQNRVTVSASASITIIPDRASISFGVTTEEATADEAQKKNSEAVSRVISVLKKEKVDEKSIRTSGYSLSPRYDWSAQEERIVGYSVSTTLTVQDQEIGNVGAILSACVDAGVNRIDSIRYLCSGYDEAYSQALENAVAAARAKAEVLAKAAGRQLGEASVVTEGWQDTSSRYVNAAPESYDTAMKASGADAMPELYPGQTEVSANVTVTYRLD